MSKIKGIAAVLGLLVLLTPITASVAQYRIIFVSDYDAIFTWGHGYYLQNDTDPPNNIYFLNSAGYSFADAFDLLSPLAPEMVSLGGHGRVGGGAIELQLGEQIKDWAGFDLQGDGTGLPGCSPFVIWPRPGELVDLKSCYSDLDPDGAEPQVSVAETLRGFLPDGVVIGYQNVVWFKVRWQFQNGTQAERANAWTALVRCATNAGYEGTDVEKLRAWLTAMSYDEHQFEPRECIMDSELDTGPVEIVFEYPEPDETPPPPPPEEGPLDYDFIGAAPSKPMCEGGVPTKTTSWGRIKSLYR